MEYINQQSKGFTKFNHKGKNVVTSLGSKSFEQYYDSLKFIKFRVGYIPYGYEHRPDLISNLFLGNSTMDWMICYFNNIKDPFNQLNVGDRILIPIL